jgi:branched-chain amino acid transport system substrate-binding protein
VNCFHVCLSVASGRLTLQRATARDKCECRELRALILGICPPRALTGQKCNASTIHWTYDTWALANGTGKAVVKNGGDSWFFLTADYAFGYALERDTAAVVEANGGKVLGKVRVPLNTSDFSSFLLQAQASKAKVIGLANAGGDTINAIKQASEFGGRREGVVSQRAA